MTSLKHLLQVPYIERLDFESLEKITAAGRPVVLRGFIEDWKARAWSPHLIAHTPEVPLLLF